jgi:photosystem II stability/assembly factor-like uncharacterized protein
MVAVDPSAPKRVYAVGNRGLYRSNDAGQTWRSATKGVAAGRVATVALDALHPRRLYAVTPAGALYLSQNGAGSWQMLRKPGSSGR